MADNECALNLVSDAATVSRTVQQLLERHRCRQKSKTSHPSSACNGTRLTGKVHQSPSSRAELETEQNRLVVVDPATGGRPDPIGGSADDVAFGFESESNPNNNLFSSPHLDMSTAAAAADLNGNDAETEALAKLRCQSVRTEVIAEKIRRKNRCADYPGFAFGFSVFSSDTMMKFNIIKNELHNIKNNLLKRVGLAGTLGPS